MLTRWRSSAVAGLAALVLLVTAGPAFADDGDPIIKPPGNQFGGPGIIIIDPPGPGAPGDPGTPEPPGFGSPGCDEACQQALRCALDPLCFGAGVAGLRPPGGGAPVPPTPAELAGYAYAQLVLPEPTIERSPNEELVWDRNGQPFTYVNLWTWFFTDPASYQQQSLRLDAFGAWGEVYAEPTALVFHPGDGGASVSCPGPGRDWTEADGDDPPPGGCGYVYRDAAHSVTSTVSIEWHVTWAGSDGSGGVYPPMVTEASSTFTVLQVQVVNR